MSEEADTQDTTLRTPITYTLTKRLSKQLKRNQKTKFSYILQKIEDGEIDGLFISEIEEAVVHLGKERIVRLIEDIQKFVTTKKQVILFLHDETRSHSTLAELFGIHGR